MDVEKECEDHVSSLENLVQQSIHLIDSLSLITETPLTEYFDQILSLKEEEDRKVEDLKKNIEVLQNKQKITRQHLASLEKKVNELEMDKEALQKQKVDLQKHLTRVKKEHKIKKNEVSKIQKQLQKDSESHSILHRNKNELHLYKQMTGISWDFRASDKLVAGYVTNKETSFLKTFSFNKEKMSRQKITEALWDIILLSSLKHSEQV